MDNDNRVIIFDTTLRDGEQSPGASMTVEQKGRVAHMLERLRVDVIEAGFPIASENDFNGVVEVAHAVTKPIVCALARAVRKDVEVAAQALEHAKHGRIHTFIATSPRHMQFKLHMSEEKVLEKIWESVTLARKYVDDVEWSAEDATRSEVDFLRRCIETAIQAGATTINIPDTVGYTIPSEYGEFIKTLITRVRDSNTVVFSTHCHNDFGLAVANSVAAIMNGVRQVECTINGIGERAGNAAMEELVMLLRTRSDIFPYYTNVDVAHITQASRLVSAVTGFPVQPNKAIVGHNAFSHESGIHQDGVLKDRETYEVMDPKDVGLTGSKLTLSGHSGRHAVRSLLGKEGYVFDDDTFDHIFEQFKKLTKEGKGITVFELLEFVEYGNTKEQGPYQVLHTTYHRDMGDDGDSVVSATVTVQAFGGVAVSCTEESKTGIIDACIGATAKAFGAQARLVRFEDQSLGEDTHTLRKTWVTLERDGHIAQASACHSDTAIAAINAYVNALNELHRVMEDKSSIERPGHISP